MLNVQEFLNSLCINDRKIVREALYEIGSFCKELQSNIDTWKDRALFAEDEMVKTNKNFIEQKRQIKNMLKSMGIKIPPGSPLSILLRKY